MDPTKCEAGCSACGEACPTEALKVDGEGLRLDLGRCLFCGACETACPQGAVTFTRDYRLSARHRDDLVLRDATMAKVEALDATA